MNKERNYTFDVIRALAILWVIGIWHLGDEGCTLFSFTSHYGDDLTTSVLASFTFISGFFLKHKPLKTPPFYGAQFLKNRFIRIIPLFFIVNCIYYAINWYHSVPQFFCSVFGLSMLTGEAPATLWYISFIILMYYTVPIILLPHKNKYRILIALILVICFTLGSKFCNFDRRLPLYSFSFFLGLCTPDTIEQVLVKRKNIIFTISLFVCVLSWVIIRPYTNSMHKIVFFIPGMCLLYYLCRFLCQKSGMIKIFSIISYASMCAYLIHRLVFRLYWFLFGHSDTSDALIIFTIPIIFALSYFIQKAYDIIIQRFNTSNIKKQ